MVDVLMSAYNAENTIERAVNSVLDQTYQRFKLYVFDDCSTDSTYDILKDISDPRLIVIHSNKNIGTYASKNYMLKNFCKSPYIALHDADDISEPRRLQLQVLIWHALGLLSMRYWSTQGRTRYQTTCFPVAKERTHTHRS